MSVMEKREVLFISLLPYQKERLEKLASLTGRPQADLCREALTLLFGAYKGMGVFDAQDALDKVVD